MNRTVTLALTLIFVLPVISACSSTPTTAPATRLPTRPPTKIVIAMPVTETTAPTLPPPTVAPPSATLPPNTPTLALTPAPTIPPGLYVTNLRIDPNPPPRGTDLTFYATFLNTTDVVQNYKWIVYIYRPDNPNRSFSETTRTETGIPVGSNESKSLGSWKIPLGGPCEYFFARVAFFDQENKAHPFARPDGQVYQKDFPVCPPSEITPAPPPPTPLPSPTPTYGPGLFVTDIRTDPSKPVPGTELTFYVTFVNTTGNVINLKWVVYIYMPDNPNRSFGETTGAMTSFPSAVGEAQSAGYWRLSLGGPCEFIARAAWLDQNNKAVFFTTFDGTPFEKRFTICPP